MQLAISSLWTVPKTSPGVLSGSGMSRANAEKQHPAAAIAMAAIRIVLRIGIPSVVDPTTIANLRRFACEATHTRSLFTSPARSARGDASEGKDFRLCRIGLLACAAAGAAKR